MIALQGYYNDGRLELAEKAPARTASVLVIFPEEYPVGQTLEDDWATFERFGGSISRVIDEKSELERGLEEKYEGIDFPSIGFKPPAFSRSAFSSIFCGKGVNCMMR